MKNKKRKMAALLALTVAIGSFSACSKKGANSDGEVLLKYLMPGPGMQEDSEVVWQAFNEKISEKVPGVKVEFEIIPLAEYKQKFMLMCSAREKIDIANNYGLEFSTEVLNGTFEPLDDLLAKYGKETLEALPEWFMDYQKVNGKIYGVPSYQMCAQLRGVAFIKEQAEKYLDIEKFTEVLHSSPVFTQEVYDILTKYIEDLNAAGYKFKDASILNVKGLENITSQYMVVHGDEGKVINRTLGEAAKVRYKTASEWFKKGYIRQDVLSATDTQNNIGKVDGYPFWDEVYSPFQADVLSERYGNEIILIPYEAEDYIGFRNSAAGTSIMATCEDKEKAMQVLNLVQSDKEVFNLLTFGIEGQHYKKTGDDSIEVSYAQTGVSENDKYGLWKWVIGNTELAYNIQTEPDEYKKWVFEESNKSDFISPLIGFVPDTTGITDYITQINAVDGKYRQSLEWGVFPDWESAYNEYEAELNKVGNQEIIDELQKQVDEFLGK